MKPTPLAKPPKNPNIVDKIVLGLEKEIRSGHFKPGDCMPSEGELGKKFEASRTAIREALQTLKARGLLVSHRGSGTFVSENERKKVGDSLSWYANLQKDASQFIELLDLRIQVETFCAHRLASSTNSLIEIEKQLLLMKKHQHDLPLFADADITFHLCLIKASGHSLFYEVANAVLPALGRHFARHTHVDPDFAARVLAEHQEIFKALENRLPTKAEQLMRTHLVHSQENLRLRIAQATKLGLIESNPSS